MVAAGLVVAAVSVGRASVWAAEDARTSDAEGAERSATCGLTKVAAAAAAAAVAIDDARVRIVVAFNGVAGNALILPASGFP